MWKQIFAVIIGYVLWSIGWLSYNSVLKKLALLPESQTQPIQDVKGLLSLLVGSIVLSLIAGYVVALIVHSTSNSPALVLGLLLLATGIFFQMQYRHVMPLWYHLLFLILLIPLCLFGASLRTAPAG